ncbi:hypothetical protein DFJ58DRAFT_847309 [Suillus subalutaceus]|uniref:uncharacterized protein n=1 Tax=Suillus subalutaceus TaxID=48586 RepID=UPI001B878F7E|nr:uncharacterized protein DFJ58DRAFT_847309 [Suillus subalutaceus]KAG1835849.1 hypothetical protein DFJ58DRAFT_847309 [Suillus subalutaceus]
MSSSAKPKLSSDPTIRSHHAALYDTLLQQNLLRLVEPYPVVEIEYVAKLEEYIKNLIPTPYNYPPPSHVALWFTFLVFSFPKKLSSELKKAQTSHSKLSSQIAKLRSDQPSRRRRFASFCSQIGIGNVREYEEHQLKVAEEESQAQLGFDQ